MVFRGTDIFVRLDGQFRSRPEEGDWMVLVRNRAADDIFARADRKPRKLQVYLEAARWVLLELSILGEKNQPLNVADRNRDRAAGDANCQVNFKANPDRRTTRGYGMKIFC